MILFIVIADMNVLQITNAPEFGVFQEYYSKFVDCLPTKELSHYLVSDGIITLIESEEITNPITSRQKATEIVLSKVFISLREGNKLVFEKLLSIMHNHGSDAIVSLSAEIRNLLSNSNGEKMYYYCYYTMCSA